MCNRICLAAMAAAAALFTFTPSARSGAVVPDGRPETGLVWGPFALDGSQVRNNQAAGAPADGSTGSAATGTARFEYDRDTDHVDYTVSWRDLAAPLLYLRVYGPAGPSQSTDDRLFDILADGVAVVGAGVGRTTGSFTGTLDLAEPPDMSCGCGEFDKEAAARTIVDALVGRRAYVSLGTGAFPLGEIRGNFPGATAAGEPGPAPSPVPLPPAAWSALVSVMGLIAVRSLPRRAKLRRTCLSKS